MLQVARMQEMQEVQEYKQYAVQNASNCKIKVATCNLYFTITCSYSRNIVPINRA